jgi:uncharacterized protein YeaO (DUF488 family)
MIKAKSVYSSIEPRKDGLRMLATRIRGRGLRKNRYDGRAAKGRVEEVV